jgi:hypothetical protein
MVAPSDEFFVGKKSGFSSGTAPLVGRMSAGVLRS